jgi:hypothetical protein
MEFIDYVEKVIKTMREIEEAIKVREELETELRNHSLYNKEGRYQDTLYSELFKKVITTPNIFIIKLHAWLESIGIGEIKEIEKVGGEGKGEEWYVVFYFPKHDIYLKCEGFYSSYEGVSFDDDWNNCFEVFPKEVTITVYETR